MANKPTPKKQPGPTPKEVVEKISRANGLTDITKKADLRESGTALPPITKK